MYEVALPISKSIANRLLLLQAIHGDPLMRVSRDMPDDVIVLHDALRQIRDSFGTPAQYAGSKAFHSSLPCGEGRGGGVIFLKNCGTALRFLEVHIEKCYPGAPITLTGDPRLMERKGAPTTQTTSARILHGEDIPVAPNESPYITMSRRIRESYSEFRERSYSKAVLQQSGLTGEAGLLEADWSASSYWYEYVAIHGGELFLEGLKENSLQGDRIVADIYAAHFGVTTEFTSEGAVIRSVSPKGVLSAGRSVSETVCQPQAVSLDFTNSPDLYPAIALTCERLGIALHAAGTERLRFKESDRIEAVQKHEVRNDHRMAMALMAADWKPIPTSPQGGEIDLQRIISKSYPSFLEQFFSLPCGEGRGGVITHITPIRGVNDDNLGKKHALSKLIRAAKTEYVWLHDDDVVWPKAINVQGNHVQCTKDRIQSINADLIILPLRMESGNAKPSLLEKLQIAEYAAIQELTMRTAKAGKAVMCSGANLIVRREAWLECEGDLHPKIPSGDDMFLLEAMKRRGKKIAVIDEPDYTAVVRPAPTWKAFFRQRMRWAGKAPKYTDPDILRCGAIVVAANILQLLCPLVLLIKFPIEYNLVKKRLTSSSSSSSVPPPIGGSGGSISSPFRGIKGGFLILLLELLYPFYLLLSLLGGLFRQQKW